MNIHYIRAAIEEAVGIKLKLPEVRDILVELGMLTHSKAKRLIFTGYQEFYEMTDTNKEIVIKDLLDEPVVEVVEDE